MNRLTDQAKTFIRSSFYEYVNGIEDCGYELQTRDEWIEYIWRDLEYGAQMNMIVNGLEYKHLFFYGKDNFVKEINKFLDTKEAQEYILK